MKHHKPFVHLHNHSHYSLLDGAGKISDLIKRAVELQFPAIALTDHGNMCGVIEFYNEAVKNGIKPIIGLEAYVAPESRFKKEKKIYNPNQKAVNAYHLILLAKNKEGYSNLVKLSSLSYQEGYYYVPRIDKELLQKYHKGLIATSACLQGEIAYHIVHDNMMAARKAAYEYKEIFGDDFYLEIQYHNIPEEKKAAKGILKIHKELNIPIIATNDTHYILREDSEAHDILLCLQTGKKVTDTNRMRYEPEQFYLKSYEEMEKLFGQIPGALQNTIEIMNKCTLSLEKGENKLPEFQIPPGFTQKEYLRKLAMEGFKKRFPDEDKIALEQLEKELYTVDKMGFNGYFLIVQDFIKFAKKEGIEVGPGRGSAAGSILSYVLEITDVNPLKYGLFFERFLNPGRKTMPDIDVDIEDTRRDEVIEYVRNKYGKDRVSQIITFNTYKTKGIIRAVGRALDIPLKTVEKIIKMVEIAIENLNNDEEVALKNILKHNNDLKEYINSDKTLKKLWEISLKLEGVNGNAGKHAAGVVIADRPLIEYVPIMLSTRDNVYITQFDMNTLKYLGVLKMDFLGLKTLSVIKDCINQIKETEKITIDWNKIPMDDEKTYNLLQKGETKGLFQMESSGMRNLLKRMKPTQFSDIVVSNALYRPGPLNSGMADEYVRRKNGEAEVKYLHPDLEEALKETYGVVVYQEQVMQITQKFAGFSLAEADDIRRAMSSKSPETMEKMKQKFIEGAAKLKKDKNLAETIFNQLAEFAGYGFNKSHSVSYAILTYRTAYLKAHYPAEFMASVMTSEMNDINKVFANMVECKKLKIKVLPPDINSSFSYFVANKIKNESGKEEKVVKFGLAAIKNVGAKLIDAIVEERKKNGIFKNFLDFLIRLDSHLLNKRTIESLIKSGAFDNLGISRKQLIENYDKLASEAHKIKEERESGQFGLFSSNKSNNDKNNFDEILNSIITSNEEWNKIELLKYEKEVLGFFISDHPLNKYKREIKKLTNINLAEIDTYPDKYQVKLVGLITGIAEKKSKDGKKFAILSIENLEGLIEGKIFSDIYEESISKITDNINGNLILKDTEPFFIKGELTKIKGKLLNLIIKKITPLKEIKNNDLISKVNITLSNSISLNEKSLIKIRDIIVRYEGKSKISLNLKINGYNILMELPAIKVNPSPEFIDEISSIIGKDNIYLD